MSIVIVNGCAYERKPSDLFRLKAHEIGHGHYEAVAYRPWVMHELDWSQDRIRDHLDMLEQHREEIDARKAERCLQNASDRARKRVRHMCKAMGADTLLTLTYRANQTDLELCKKHLKEFVRRLRRVIPDFCGVAAFEQQKRGAWHVHMACRRFASVLTPSRTVYRVRSYDLIRSIWRSVVGDLGGNIDVARKKSTSKRSPARLASYLSKYITKAFEAGHKFMNRWTSFGDIAVPPAIDLGLVTDARQAIQALFDLAPNLCQVETAYLSRFGDMFFIAGQSPGET